MKPVNDAALGAVCSVEPIWVEQKLLAELLTDRSETGRRIVLHAGPPFQTWDSVPQAIRNSMVQAAVFEGWASSIDEAECLFATEAVDFAPAQDYDCVVPLAGVISPSMGLHVFVDLKNPTHRSHAAINEGMDHLLRVGKIDENLVEFHRWLNGDFNSFLADRLGQTSGIALLPLIEKSLKQGDDAHSRTMAGSSLIVEALRESDVLEETPQIKTFLDSASSFALNLWMGAAALALRAAEQYPESDLITRVGGNGVDFGFQTASNPGDWIIARGMPPAGPVEEAYARATILAAVGDSAVVDFYGLGGGAVRWAPNTISALEGFLPERILERAKKVFLCEHPRIPVRSGVSRAQLAMSGVTPLVLLGMIEATGEHGRIGGGAYMPHPSVFA